jgi:outer membrane protein assembly factor BamB
MRRSLTVVSAALVAAGLLAASCSSSSDSGDGGTGATTSIVPAGAPAEVAADPTGWVLPGHDYDNSRTATGSAIRSGNLRQLELAWKAPVDGGLSTVPLIVGDTVYVQDGSGTVRALDATTGAERWKSEAFGFGIGPYGVAVADGRVFAMHGSTGVVALDASNGHELWTAAITATPTTGIDIQPLVYDGMVLVSTVPVSTGGIYQGGDHGVINALDAATGAVRWTWDTVEPGLWGNPEVNSGGGAWYPPAVDVANGRVIWGIANPAPFVGTPEFPNGSSRPGDNLYTDSAVALDVGTGALEWYHQVHPHDLFDRDLVHSLIARPPGKAPVVVATGKGAVLVGLDPDTGDLLWQTPVGHHENDELTTLDGPTLVAPGSFGGVITPPATADGVVYAAVIDAPVTYVPDETAYFGATPGQADGQMAAVDAATGRLLWQTDVPGDPFGAATVINDVVLTATLQGTLVALDRENGEVVWQQQLPGGTNGWMSVAGDLLVVPIGIGDPTQVVAFRLG